MVSFQVRDVVDTDVALHGRRFIVTEFALVALVAVAIAAIEVRVDAATAVYAAVVGINCVTFMFLAATRPRLASSALPSVYWLTFLALVLLFVPLVFPAAALIQRRVQ